MSEEKYVTSSAIRRKYAISNATLVNWANGDKVRTLRLSERGKRIYNANDVAKALGVDNSPSAFSATQIPLKKVCYARVSSAKQAQDLERQATALQKANPNHAIIKEIGSGINWKRPKFLALLDSVMRGEVDEIVVAHRDRVARFAFDLILHICRQFKCKILVLNTSDTSGVNRPGHEATEEGNPISAANEQELAEDLIAIITCFTASIHGRRSAENRRKRAATQEEAETSSEEEADQGSHAKRRIHHAGGDDHSAQEDEEDSDLSNPATKRRA